MVTMSQIEELAQRIRREFHPERIILFGSYSQGPVTEDSDIDLLVVAQTSLPANKRYAAVRRLVADVPAAFDIIVKTPDEYNRWRSVVNHIVYFADKYGKVIYERGCRTGQKVRRDTSCEVGQMKSLAFSVADIENDARFLSIDIE